MGNQKLIETAGAETEIGSIMVSEIEWPETREFAIEIKQGDACQEVARGTTIGRDKEVFLTKPAKASRVRLNVLKAARPVNIHEFQVFPPVVTTPSAQ